MITYKKFNKEGSNQRNWTESIGTSFTDLHPVAWREQILNDSESHVSYHILFAIQSEEHLPYEKIARAIMDEWTVADESGSGRSYISSSPSVEELAEFIKEVATGCR
jgi:hypothetical protein